METSVYFRSMQEEPVVVLHGAPAEAPAEEIQASLVEWYPFLSNATYTEEYDETEGDFRFITFVESLGTKGKI